MSNVPRTPGNPNLASFQRIRGLEREVHSLTLENGRLAKSLTIANTECNALRQMNATVSVHTTHLQHQTQKLQQFGEVCSRFPILSHHVASLMESTSQRTPRYNSKVKPFYILAGWMGETLYQLCDRLFGFPS
jgi:hypothetical protein